MARFTALPLLLLLLLVSGSGSWAQQQQEADEQQAATDYDPGAFFFFFFRAKTCDPIARPSSSSSLAGPLSLPPPEPRHRLFLHGGVDSFSLDLSPSQLSPFNPLK